MALVDNTQIARAASDPVFYNKAFSEYLLDKQEKYNELVNLYTIALQSDTLLTTTNVDAFIAANSSFVNVNAYVPFNDGFIKLRDMLIATSSGVEKLRVNSDETPIPSPLPTNYQYMVTSSCYTDLIELPDISSEYDAYIDLVDGLGVQLTKKLSLLDVSNGLQESLYSITSLVGAVKSMDIENIANRLSYFRDYVTRTFKNPFNDLSNVGSHFAKMLESCPNPAAFIQNLKSQMDVDNLADEESDAVVGGSDISQYTGASPMGPLDFSSTCNLASSVIKTGAQVVSSVLSSLFSGLKSLVTSSIDKVVKLATDPEDLEVINKSSTSFSIDGWNLNGVNHDFSALTSLDLSLIEDIYREQFVNSLSSNIYMSTIFSDLIIHDIDYRYSGASANCDPLISFQYRLKSINPAVVLAALNSTTVTSNITRSNVLSIINKIRTAPDLYLDVDSSEGVLACGFQVAYLMFNMTAYWIGVESEAANPSTANYGSVLLYGWLKDAVTAGQSPSAADNPLPNVITNLQFVSLASGYDLVAKTFPSNVGDHIYYELLVNGSHDTGYSTCIWNLLTAYVNNRIQRFNYPLSYLFLPFTANTVVFDNPRFRIKTDADNFEAWNSFATNAIVIAIIAIVAISAFVAIRKAAIKASLKASTMEFNYGDKLANGTATTADWKALKRAKLSARLLGSATNCLQSAGNSSVGYNQSYLDPVLIVLRGF